MRTRAERRERTYSKWCSKLKKLWNTYLFSDVKEPVKTSLKYHTRKTNKKYKAESWKDFKDDKFGVMFKNTGTIMRDAKRMDIQEEHKRRVENKRIPEDQLYEE